MADLAHQPPTGPESGDEVHAELERTFLGLAARETSRFLTALNEVPNSDLVRFAAKAPDRMCQALTIVAKLAHLTEPDRVQIHAEIRFTPTKLRQMSDMEIRRLTRELDAQLLALESGTAATPSPDDPPPSAPA